MNQPLIVGFVMLAAFGLVGAVLGGIWRQRPFPVPIWLLAAGLVIAVVGVWLVVSQVDRLEQHLVLRGWSTAPGTIVASRVIGTRAFRPEIVYEYQVGEAVYRDSTSLDPPSFGGRNSKRGAAEAIASEYAAGKPVTIHYDPSDPARSRLKITAPWSVYGQLGFGAFLFGAGLFLGAAYFRKI